MRPTCPIEQPEPVSEEPEVEEQAGTEPEEVTPVADERVATQPEGSDGDAGAEAKEAEVLVEGETTDA